MLSSEAAVVADYVVERAEFESGYTGAETGVQDCECRLLEEASFVVERRETFFWPLGKRVVSQFPKEKS